MIKHLPFAFLLFVSVLLPGQTTDGLVADYTFNSGNAVDEAGKNDGKIVGAALVKDRFGNPRSAYYLQGNYNSYINLGTSSTLKPVKATISLWVNIDRGVHKGQGVPYNPIIITKSHGGNDFYEGYFMGFEKETFILNCASATDEAQGVTVTGTEPLSLNNWHHLVMCYNDEYMWLYVDGLLQNDNKPMVKNFRTQFLETDSVVVGNMANIKNKRCMSGCVDDIRIYNRVLSLDEVYELYKAPDPNKNRIYWLWFARCIGLILIVTVIVILITKRYRQALANEKEKNRVSMRLIDLETKAIRTQMNPHFMFNSLNTLQRFILEEDIKGAHSYLAKFSKLLRKILESSTAESVSLAEEIEILNSYLEIEKLRFSDSFEYQITCIVPDPGNFYIPFLLVQPFVENAIWHGLLPMKGNRQLSIDFSMWAPGMILCVVEDNGVGREYSAGQKDPLKKKSLALEFIKQRLELLEKSTGATCSYKITDKINPDGSAGGTRVEITIPKLN
ncbi:MAG: histidine kinase [Bacteroidota bacterium]